MLKKLGGSLLVVLIVALGVYGLVGAQEMAWRGQPPSDGRLDVLSEVLGLTMDELHAALQAGQTVAEIAEAQGVPLDDVVDAAMAPMAAQIRERFETGFAPGMGGPMGRPLDGGPEVLAEALGLTVDELHAAFQAGQTVAEIAEAQGVPLEDVVAAVVAVAEEHLTALVEAGRLTPDEADARLAEIAERTRERFENPMLPGECGLHPGGRMPLGGRMPPGGRMSPGGRGRFGETGPLAPDTDN